MKQKTRNFLRCFVLSKDLAEYSPVSIAEGTNLSLNPSKIEILRVFEKLQSKKKLNIF